MLMAGKDDARQSAPKGSISAHMRPIASGKRWGRVRVAVRRAFIVSNGQPVCVRDVLVRAYPRLRRFNDWHRWSARRALLQVAVVIGRNRFGSRASQSLGAEMIPAVASVLPNTRM
jgi:hypothetical protein